MDLNQNLILKNLSHPNPIEVPQFVNLIQIGVKTCFIRGNSIRYIELEKNDIDLKALSEACINELKKAKKDIP